MGGSCSTENFVLLGLNKFDKGRRIVCLIVRACVDVIDVHKMKIVTGVQCIRVISIHNNVDGQEREIVFEWAFIVPSCGV